MYGDDNNLYIAGYSAGLGTSNDFIVTSMTDPQNIHWTYRYNGPGNSSDQAHAVCYGDDGNVYAAGYSFGSGTSYDFTVISLAAVGIEENVTQAQPVSFLLQNTPNPFKQMTEIRYQITV